MDLFARILIIKHYILLFFYLITFIYFLTVIYKFVKKGQNIVSKKYIDDEQKLRMQKHMHIYNFVLLVVILILMSVEIWFLIPGIRCLPSVISQRPKTDICIVETSWQDESFKNYTVCKTKNKTIAFYHSGESIPQNSIIKVNYYEEIEIGYIVNTHYIQEELHE